MRGGGAGGGRAGGLFPSPAEVPGADFGHSGARPLTSAHLTLAIGCSMFDVGSARLGYGILSSLSTLENPAAEIRTTAPHSSSARRTRFLSRHVSIALRSSSRNSFTPLTACMVKLGVAASLGVM